ncbi:DUF4097 family beta strand repeat protein [Kribbella sandramycini]|uniref:DUF4097 and DUF4098 domain-containing protein YvlB n=1 Tax=Kribbella sandramycini TaxID=60450 RepID=A0A7Y4KZJ3_9ACTN|nr:DUF4097 family beta strand repeat-containing protein [Kribbella sandramycini]MBB6565279.1 DUF4097 and DUF4098 domain-containing protein YvlB [Kribbella sandramycini]NOL41548.1 DUF4097 family beta strand repeat protein [Kribbella sandramycini]
MSGFTGTLTGEIGKARIDIGSGEIELVPTDGAEAEVTLEVEGADEDDVRFEIADGELIVEQRKDRRYATRRGPEIHVRIATPAVVELRVQTGSGDLSARVPVGATRVVTGSGDVRLQDVEGDLAVRTGSGDVRVGNVSGTAKGTTGSGSIDIAAVGAAIGLSTGSGDVRVGDAAGQASIKVGSGDITIERIRDHSIATSGSGDVVVEVADGPSIQAETARGDVRVGVPDGVPTYLDLKTVTGRIRCELQPGQKPASDERSLMLRARTVSGDITVVKV